MRVQICKIWRSELPNTHCYSMLFQPRSRSEQATIVLERKIKKTDF